jgi:uncharacterized protein (DUF58 family)
VSTIGRLWGRHLFDRVTLRRSLSETRAFIDEPVILSVELENLKLLPLPWYEWRVGVSQQIVIEGQRLAAAAMPGMSWLVRRGAIGWYERQRWAFSVRASERGRHQFGPGSMHSADLFGFFPGHYNDNDTAHLVVFPRVFSLPELGFPADRPFGELKGASPVFEDPRRIAGIREYRPGDPLRRVDWKATARSGEMQSRVYEPSGTRQVYILLNIDTLEHSWEGYLKDELERSVSTAASLAAWACAERYAVGLLANGGLPEADRPIRLAPSGAPDQLTRLLEALAIVQPLTMSDLADVVNRERGRVPAGSTIILVASLIPSALAAAVRRLADEGNTVIAVITSHRTDTSELGPIPVHRVATEFQPLELVR